MELKAIETEGSCGEGLGWVSAIERGEIGCGKTFKFADAGIGALKNGGGLKRRGEDADDGLTDALGEQAPGKQLDDDEIGVFVDDEAGEVVRLAEAEAAGVGFGGEESVAAGDGGGQALREKGQPCRVLDGFAGDEAKGDL